MKIGDLVAHGFGRFRVDTVSQRHSVSTEAYGSFSVFF